MTYKVKWEAMQDDEYTHTASTMYVAEGFKIWKGRRRIYSVIYSADEWHLIRTADGEELHSGKTAKECKGALEFYLNTGRKCCGNDLVFNDDFTDYQLKALMKPRKRK